MLNRKGVTTKINKHDVQVKKIISDKGTINFKIIIKMDKFLKIISKIS